MSNLYKFKVHDKNYTFDGNKILIFEGDIINNQAYIPKEIDGHKSQTFSNLALVISKECNLKCSYCYVNDFSKIDINHAKNSIYLLYKSVTAHYKKTASISFFGGEPLLEFEMIKELVKFANDLFKNITIRYGIVTNGTLLNDDNINFLKTHNFRLIVSLDGDKESHNANRIYKKDSKGSYDDVIAKINTYKDKINISCRLTITTNNFDLYENIASIRQSCGVNEIIFGIDSNISKDSFDKFLISLDKVYEKYYSDILSGDYYIIKNITGVIYNIVLGQRNISHCNAGIAYFAYVKDGYYLCHRFVGNKLGCKEKITNENTLESIEKEIIKFDKELKSDVGERFKSCENCAFKYLCGGMCYHHAAMLGKKILYKDNQDCIFKKTLIKSAIKLNTKLPVDKRREFLIYLTEAYSSH